MSDDEKSLIKDVLKSEGWRIMESMNSRAIENLRQLATQPPGAVEEQMRTWYSAMAQGREDFVAEIKEKVL